MKNQNKTNTIFKMMIALAVVVLNLTLFVEVVGAQNVFVDEACYKDYINKTENKKECEELDKAYKECSEKAIFDIDKENCTVNFSGLTQSCKEKLEFKAEAACKTFDEYINVLKTEAASKFPQHTTTINKCYDDEFTDDKLKECKTNDLDKLNKCLDDAFTTNKETRQECIDDKVDCKQQKTSFLELLCKESKTEIEKNECLNRNKTSIEKFDSTCASSVKNDFDSCINKTVIEYNRKTNECGSGPQLKEKDQECFEKVAAPFTKECVPICGDSNVDSKYGEECDDGNTINGDGCNEQCRNEICGNGIVDKKGEECDDGADKNGKPGALCDAECKFVDQVDKFDVSRYLKIDEGQSYLEANTGDDKKVSLQRGIVFFILKAIDFITKIIGSFALLFIIAGGILLMISSGNSGMQQKGKRMILYAILGLVIAFTSLVIVTFVQSLFYTT